MRVVSSFRFNISVSNQAKYIYTGCTKLNNLSKNVSFSDMKEGELQGEFSNFISLGNCYRKWINGSYRKRTEGVSKKSLLNARKL